MKKDSRATTIPRRQSIGPTPASYAQRRLWFLDRLEPDSTAYNMPFTLQLSGQLDIEALRRAFELITHRHDVLRTTFEAREGEPFQHVHPPARWEMPLVDLSALPGPTRDEESHRLAAQEACRPFDLGRGPLLRTMLLKLAETEHVLLVNMHHIISDGWSTGVMMREFAAHYEALRQGQHTILPELPVQYADYAAWQQQWLTGKALERQLLYWTKQLAGVPSALRLPTDRPRSAVPNGRGAELVVMVPAPVTDGLRELAHREGATLFMVLLAAFQMLLSRLTGQEDIVVGAPIAGRATRELEGLIGFFVNTIVLRANLSGDPTFSELLAQVTETTLGAYSHQDVPFEMLVEKLAPRRDPARTPLFQVMFTVQSAWSDTVRLPGLTATPRESHNGMAKFDLTLQVRERTDGLEAAFEYNADLFDASTVERIGQYFTTLLEGLQKAGGGARCRTLPLLSEDNRRRLQEEWNATASDFPRDRCVHELFEEQVAIRPDAVAVEFGEESLTYRELNVRANRVAHVLRARGVGPESRVGLCVERSSAMITALLGILKAGGAYVPLDPRNPAERLAFMARDVGLGLVVTSREHRHVAEGLGEVLELGSWLESSSDIDNPVSGARAGNLVYVMYTSGSTGEPKGVAIEHRNVNRLVRGTSYADFGPEEVFLQLAPIAFDASTFEIFGCLLNGGRLVVHPPEAPSLRQLSALVEQRGVTTLWLTAGLFHQLVQEDAEALSRVRQVLAGGDALSSWHVRRFLEAGGRRLINGYGPTETTTFACCYTVERPEQVGESVPIGRPIANMTAYVVDEEGELVPVGVEGELWIGGEGVARGYWNRPELTAARFVANRWGPGRLYRTGDRVRWRPDGTLEFLGRTDFQVKLRGFRIEMGEVESVLRRHPAVRDAVLQVREDTPGDKRLVAYLTLDPRETPPAGDELREYLRRNLPEYMVPSAFVLLPNLPLTRNGKVDRKALPAPETPASADTSVAPRTEEEARLAALFAQVLRMEQVGVRDDFFALGGHSLLATQLVSRIRQSFGVELPLRSLFEAPTVEALARRIQASARTEAPPLVPVPRSGPLPLSFAQQRLWFLGQLEPSSTAYNIPSAIQLEGGLDAEALRRAFEHLLARHESLRTVFISRDDQPLQLIHPPPVWQLPVIDLSDLPPRKREEELARLTSREASVPFSLSTGPMLRTTLLRLEAERHVLLLTLHHIVSDGWSMGVLVREVASLYETCVSGLAPSLPPLPVQYADYAAWQRSWLRGPVLTAQVDWWKQQLSGAPTALDLPTDKPRPPVPSRRGGSVQVHLPRPLADRLTALAHQHQATPFMVLLAAFQTLLSRYSGQEDIVVGSPIAGRTRAETEGLIGFFVNTLVLRSRLRADESFASLLARVRASTLSAFEHQDVPFEKLVEELQPRRDLSRPPLFQVLFVLQNAPVQALRLPGLTLRQLETDTGSAKFDLSLALAETAEGFSGTLEYSADLFEPDTVARMANHLCVLLEGALVRPEQPLSALPLLSELERRQALSNWNASREDFPQDCIHDLFEAQARLTPDALALSFQGQQLSFRQLDARANQLAWHLHSLGVGPEVRVGLYLQRSNLPLIAILAILKAGGAYVPLDPLNPRERLGFLIEDASIQVLLTQRALRPSLPAHSAHVVVLDDEDFSRSGIATQGPPFSVTPEHLAYVIYTSGSTGRPKGVAIQHGSVTHLWRALARTIYADVTAPLRVSVNVPLAFDASVMQLVQLLSGHSLHMVPEEVRADAGAMMDFIRTERLDVLECTPSYLRLLLDQQLVDTGLLQRVLVGGEAVDASMWAALACSPRTRFFNVYGPTECTVATTVGPVHSFPDAPTLGRPLPNIQTYVLDTHLQPVPVGVPGELFISGAGLARGYLGRPELTAERFVPDPFSQVPSARLYRTGDRVRWRADGTLDFLGRIDFQVKLRGFRIELGEIEALLRQHPDVRDATLLVREDVADNQRLVAYLVAEGEAARDTSLLREHLRRNLPEYMVPSAYVLLPTLPLTHNGKVDRKALPAPEAATGGPVLPPRDRLELLLAEVWQQTLRVPSVGVTQDFFELGGHSLLAVSLMTKLGHRLGCRLPVATLFAHPTIERLAALLRREGDGTNSPLVPMQPHGSRRPLFCVHPIGGSVLGYSTLVRHLGPDQSVYGLEAPSLHRAHAPYSTIESMAAAYVEAVRQVQQEGPYRLAGWSMGGVVAFEMAAQLSRRGATVELLVLLDSWAPALTPELWGPPLDEQALLEQFAHDLSRAAGHTRPLLSAGEMTPLAHEAKRNLLLRRAREAGLLPPDVGMEVLDALLRTFQAHEQALRQYVPSHVLTCPLVLFRPEQAARETDLAGGWDKMVRSPLDLRRSPGDHYTLLAEPHVRALAHQLRDLLEP